MIQYECLWCGDPRSTEHPAWLEACGECGGPYASVGWA